MKFLSEMDGASKIAGLSPVATSGSYNDLSDKPTIVDNLSSTDANKVLSANQGRILDQQISTKLPLAATNDLSTLTDFNTFTAVGVYHGVLTVAIPNEPYTGSSARRLTVIVTSVSGLTIQEVTYDDATWAGKKFRRMNVGSWKPWAELLTSTGGTLTGYLEFGDSTTYIGRAGNVFDFVKGWVSIRLDSNLGAGAAAQIRNTGSGALYKIYSEANITISTAAPSSALAEGYIHMVY